MKLNHNHNIHDKSFKLQLFVGAQSLGRLLFRGKIVVDDQASLRNTFRIFLERAGYETVVAVGYVKSGRMSMILMPPVEPDRAVVMATNNY